MTGKRANGSQVFGVAWPWALATTLLVASAVPGMAPRWQDPAAAAEQDPAATAEIERLRGQLDQPGPDGRDARERAIARLLAMPWPSAHRPLQEILVRSADPDAVRASILAALRSHWLMAPASQFGGATVPVRAEILSGYVAALARFWSAAACNVAPSTQLPVGNEGALARLALQEINAREFEDAVRTLWPLTDVATKEGLLRCIADLQQLYLAPLLAEFLEDLDPAVRAAARASLRLLTFHESEFTTKELFADWLLRNPSVRYVDLAERAAREAEARTERARQVQMQDSIDRASEFVRAMTSRKPGIDWAAIQTRMLVDSDKVLGACLAVLAESLAAGLPADDSAQARQAFCRALLQRWRVLAADQISLRSKLLEVVAYTVRVEDAELAPEVIAVLLSQLEATSAEEQMAALRGLRRFPTVDTRSRVVRMARALLPLGQAVRPQLEVAVSTLGARTQPRWYAPAEVDVDKAEWLALVRSLCTDGRWQDLREAGLKLALTLDARDQRLSESFFLLLDCAKDATLESKFRSSCLIQLQGWRDIRAEDWATAMYQMLDDPAPEIRQVAAESLAVQKDAVDDQRTRRLIETIASLRDHLQTETSPSVLRALVDSMQVCGREPQMPERAIGALNRVLGELGNPVPPEQQFRLEQLLGALATIAGDSRADRGQWVGACGYLEQHGKRDSLRLVLQNHSAVDLAKDVTSTDPGLADRARQAMHWLIRTALMKPPRPAWTASDELLREARDVRNAFTALENEKVDATYRLDEARHRLLRLEVELACGSFQDVVQRTTAWLSATPMPNPSGAARVTFTADERDRMRCLAAEAQLGLGKADLAARLLAERDPELGSDARLLDLQGRIAKVLFQTDQANAVAMFERVFRATPPDDAQFRARLVDWANARTRHDPGSRAATLAEIERHAALFDAQDCPLELRKAFQDLRGQR